jgi:hypothetical protein
VPAIDVMAATGVEGKERKALLKELLGDVHDVRAQADANSTLRHAVLLALSGPAGARPASPAWPHLATTNFRLSFRLAWSIVKRSTSVPQCETAMRSGVSSSDGVELKKRRPVWTRADPSWPLWKPQAPLRAAHLSARTRLPPNSHSGPALHRHAVTAGGG